MKAAVGAQWELPGAMARRDPSHALDFSVKPDPWTPRGCRPSWFEKQPEGRSRRSATGSRGGEACALGAPNDHQTTRLSAPTGIAIPIACRGAMGIAGGLWRAKTSTRRLRISRRSRLPATGRAKARWICPFASSTSRRSGFCQCWFEKQPERAITELGE